MEIELNRRTFLIVLGVATTAAAGVRSQPRAYTSSPSGPPLCYFAPNCPKPTARPRTAAITYLRLSASQP